MAVALQNVDSTVLGPFKARFKGLMKQREPFEAHWMDLRDYELPDTGRWTEKQERDQPADRGLILNPIAEQSVDTLSAGLMAGVTSPARPWFRLAVTDPELNQLTEVREYLDDLRTLMISLFSRSNLYRVLPTLYMELGVYGTGLIYCFEDKKDVIRFYATTIGEFWLAQNERLEIDTIYRRIPMTISNMVKKWPGTISEAVKKRYENNDRETKANVIHVIEPNNRDLPADARPLLNFEFISNYYEEGGDGNDKFLEVGGTRTFPAMAPRWRVRSSDTYGRGAGSKALPDVKEIMLHELNLALGVEKEANPPINIPSTQGRNPINHQFPGGESYYDPALGVNSIQPTYQVNFPIEPTLLSIKRREDNVKRYFHADLFRMITDLDRRQITAREIMERREEKLLQLGPTLERLFDELLDKIIMRVYEIINNNPDIAPEIPEALQGQQVEIEYISVLASAQQAVGIASIERVFQFAGEVAAMSGDPSGFDVMDVDEAVREVIKMSGAPTKLEKDQDEVDAIRQQRQAQQLTAQTAQLAEQAGKAAQSLSNADLDGNTALTQLADRLGVAR